VTGIEGEIYQYRNQSSQDPLNFPIKLNNKLAALQGVVESADSKPTDRARVARSMTCLPWAKVMFLRRQNFSKPSGPR
jgi:hypothetical protein